MIKILDQFWKKQNQRFWRSSQEEQLKISETNKSMLSALIENLLWKGAYQHQARSHKDQERKEVIFSTWKYITWTYHITRTNLFDIDVLIIWTLNQGINKNSWLKETSLSLPYIARKQQDTWLYKFIENRKINHTTPLELQFYLIFKSS